MNGVDNEYAFVLALNNKCIGEINILLQDVIYDIFEGINSNDVIKCWRNHLKQKSDIFIKINGVIKGISIKLGSRNSIHVEHIKDFCNFLYDLGASKDLVKKYLSYHFADGTTNGKGVIRQSAEQYKKNHQDAIDEINEFLNKQENLDKAISRFVTKGINSNYKIDGIIYGTVNDFLWIKTDNIKKVLMFKLFNYSTPIHFSSLICQPLNRCLNYNSRYSYGRFYVQIKWYSLFDDIILINSKSI